MSEKDKHSDGGDPEDLPSDFFDDFSKDEFLKGLSVIDSWDDDENNSKRKINIKTLDNVKDLRELIGDGKVDDKGNKKENLMFDKKYKWIKDDPALMQSGSERGLDDLIKPGSRRDPNKTNEAIKKDKETKVKEYLAKHLESFDDLRPPGTELDDYYTERKGTEKMKNAHAVEESKSSYRESREYQRSRRVSPARQPRSPRRFSRRSPRHVVRHSPRRNYHHSPVHNVQYFSPPRKFRRQSPRWSPRRRSPLRRSPRRVHHSRSPIQRRSYTTNTSRSPLPQRDSFLYPQNSDPYSAVGTSYQMQPFPSEYPVVASEYPYSQGQPYTGYTGLGYEYGTQMDIPAMPPPQPVPAPILDAVPAIGLNPIQNSTHTSAEAPTPILNSTVNIGPAMVPPPSQIIAPSSSVTSTTPNDAVKPYDALAQLVADGKLSKEDYLKLAPNKGMGNNLDPKNRVMVLTRCNQAITKLSYLLLPSRLIMNNDIIGQEPKSLVPKYCSPLKRQAAVEFQFTKTNGTSVQQNKQLVDSIIATIGLDKVVTRPKKKAPKDVKDAAVQTTRPFCEVCEIRDSTKMDDASTATNPEYFTTSTHTQVVEQDLISSKSIFNPTGSASGSTPMSIAHMTPAQLVSTLAARAKTLKQTDPGQVSNQLNRRNAPNNYDNRGGQYHNYNYRY